MKINFLLPTIGDSGGMKVVCRYAEMLHKLGHDVVIYRSIKSPNLRRYRNPVRNLIHVGYCSAKSVVVSLKKRRTSPFDRYVSWFCNRTIRDADVVIATSWPTAYAVNRLDRSKGKKFYFIQDFEIWDNQRYGMNSYKLPLNKIVISTWINHQLKEKLNLGPFPVVPNGVDISEFHNSNKTYHHVNGEIRCFMLNHHLKKKGVEEGLKAFELAREQYPQLTIRMFGMGDGSNLPPYVSYTQNPSRRELIDLYCTSDIFLFPSLEEGWGLTPVEAMACKCAVCGTNTGFVLDVGKDHENMLISEPGNIEELADNLCELCADRKLLMKLSENAAVCAQSLSWEESLSKMSRVLSSDI